MRNLQNQVVALLAPSLGGLFNKLGWNITESERKPMKTVARMISAAAMTLVFGALVSPAHAQSAWSALPGGCASTESNFHIGTPSEDFPVARFKVPGGAFTHNAFHDGSIAVVCNVDNPRDSSTSPRWSQLQVTYRDPDGLEGLNGKGTEYQVFVELVRVSKTTGAVSRIAVFDSNKQCSGTSCQGTVGSEASNIAVPFTHTFDFNNFAYAVHARLQRAIAIFNLRPALFQLRLQAQPLLIDPGTVNGTLARF